MLGNIPLPTDLQASKGKMKPPCIPGGRGGGIGRGRGEGGGGEPRYVGEMAVLPKAG